MCLIETSRDDGAVFVGLTGEVLARRDRAFGVSPLKVMVSHKETHVGDPLFAVGVHAILSCSGHPAVLFGNDR